jgi:hypothetical protein
MDMTQPLRVLVEALRVARVNACRLATLGAGGEPDGTHRDVALMSTSRYVRLHPRRALPIDSSTGVWVMARRAFASYGKRAHRTSHLFAITMWIG